MEKGKTTERVVEYIKSNHISVEQIERDLHISASLLKGEAKEKLMADDFLRLCSYLNVKPEEFK